MKAKRKILKKNKQKNRLNTAIRACKHDLSGTLSGSSRRCNLRVVSAGYNARNRTVAKNNTSKVTGVSWNKQKKKWTAAISFQGHTYYLGAYVLFDEAVAARKAAEEKYFGAYSYDNSIEAVPRVERDGVLDEAAVDTLEAPTVIDVASADPAPLATLMDATPAAMKLTLPVLAALHKKRSAAEPSALV